MIARLKLRIEKLHPYQTSTGPAWKVEGQSSLGCLLKVTGIQANVSYTTLSKRQGSKQLLIPHRHLPLTYMHALWLEHRSSIAQVYRLP